MKNVLFILFLGPFFLSAQGPSFELEIPADSFLMHNAIEISYTLENSKGWNMLVDEFTDFEVIAGPNYSSNFSMINGEINQSQSMTYYIRPVQEGRAMISAASVETDEGLLELKPVEVYILSNPEETEKDYRLKKDSEFNFDMDPPVPEKKKTKRKVYKI